ncbi:MAG: carbohydrate kinase family protein, partial [Chloroflexota bacterium]
MIQILVSGLINIETTLRIDGFPIDYFPVRYPFFGINSSVSGVGYNVAKALTVLGDRVHFLSLIGRDFAGDLVFKALKEAGISRQWVLPEVERTAQSVILFDPGGRRQIHTDLKDVQEKPYPFGVFEQALQGCSLAALCNINFSRPLLQPARQAHAIVATDLHAIADVDDAYNREFFEAADILFMSDERLPCPPEEWARMVMNRYRAEIVVVGLGARGALLSVRSDRFSERLPAVATRPVVNSIGAGDALFSSFIHFYHSSGDPYLALRKAMV